MKTIVNLEDIYGNNALALACINDIETKKVDKYKCIEFLVKICKADPNVANIHTGFTPLHWSARHGELRSVKMMCEYGNAQMHIPDARGFTPIDYAGKFEHKPTL